MVLLWNLVLLVGFASPSDDHHMEHEEKHVTTCGWHKEMYRKFECCGQPDKETHLQLIPASSTTLNGKANPCHGTKPVGEGWDNTPCMVDGVVAVLEQAGTNVTVGYKGQFESSALPLTVSFFEAGLCPVNVHWHLGAEHFSQGEYDDDSQPPQDEHEGDSTHYSPHVRQGFRCHLNDHHSAKFLTEYPWQYCENMKVGETYEIHWPHSAAGACGTPSQYQTPFYDGVFCKAAGIINGNNTNSTIGVQAQVFTVVNDEAYYYPDLIKGMIVDGAYGQEITKYTGSTTGTSRNNSNSCSMYTPITWQVDRKCHLISASSFDKMCADMKAQRDDMSTDCEPHGARELVLDKLAADNHVRRRLMI